MALDKHSLGLGDENAGNRADFSSGENAGALATPNLVLGAMPTLVVGMRIAEKFPNMPTASVGMAPQS
jgi:hypothetical protein